MTHQQVLHEIGLLVLGSSGAFFAQRLPLDVQIKQIVSIGIGLVTLAMMASVAGVV